MRDPVFAISYGQSKVGKTTDNCYSFPNAFYLAQPGALNPSVAVCGFQIPPERIYDAADIEDARAKIREIAKSKKFREVVVDDFSFLADKTMRKFASPKSEGGLALDGWKLWGAVYNRVLDFRDDARHAGVHVILNAHEKLPNLPARRGGPRLPGQLPEQMPAACDLVVRAMMLPSVEAQGRLGWPGVYRCAPWDTAWITGDRNNVALNYAPLNMGELLRAAGYDISRPPGLDKMEQFVEAMAADCMAGDPRQQGGLLAHDRAIARQYAQFFEQQQVPPLLVRWVIRDAIDRVAIRRARANVLGPLGI